LALALFGRPVSQTPSPILSAPAAAGGAIATLRRLARPRPAAPTADERCELCSAPIGGGHQHLFDPAARQLLCTCDACALLFSSAQSTKYRRVPRRIESWPDLRLTDVLWDSLGVPIGLAFAFHSTPVGGPVAVYPSPAGPTESPIPAEPWRTLVEDNPRVATLAPDVEALLVNRTRGARDQYRVPIDECYRLVGLVRTHWRGFSGGPALWQHIGAFFADLAARSKHAGGTSRA
jgi:hypothetical protein